MIPLTFRNDGFTTFFREPDMTRETIEAEYIDVLQGSNVRYIGWGAGPSSVFCYDTQVGEYFGECVTDEQWKLFRTADRWVYENLTRLIETGNDPLEVAVERAHKLRLKVYCRYQMNHEYSPAREDNFLWVGFVGKFNKEHPEFRIPGTTHLDFKHEEVRAFKHRIIEEIARKGVDAVMVDFTVYPPHTEKPDSGIMTTFIRDAREILVRVGAEQKRTIELIVELPYQGAVSMGFDWRTWMDEGLIDVIVPTRMRSGEIFDVRIDDFVRHAKQTGCRVWGFIWFALGFVSTDPMPSDEDRGIRRYEKPKTRGMFFAQAQLFHRAGVDAIEIADSAGLAWKERPWYNDLADPFKVRYADKHYTVDPSPHIPMKFDLPANQPYVSERRVAIRIADDIAAAIAAGFTVRTALIFYSRRLDEGERLSIHINEYNVACIEGRFDMVEDEPVDWKRDRPNWLSAADNSFISDPDWWRRGEHRVEFDPEILTEGENVLYFYYESTTPESSFETSWIDLLIEYDQRTSL